LEFFRVKRGRESKRHVFSRTYESRAGKKGALNKDPLWPQTAISPFQVEKIYAGP
jgi:hypothetical protein